MSAFITLVLVLFGLRALLGFIGKQFGMDEKEVTATLEALGEYWALIPFILILFVLIIYACN